MEAKVVIKCLKCDETLNSVRGLATHIQHRHKLTSEQYVVECVHGGVAPCCLSKGCLHVPSFRNMEFRKYCSAHVKEAQREAGYVTGLSNKVVVPQNSGLNGITTSYDPLTYGSSKHVIEWQGKPLTKGYVCQLTTEQRVEVVEGLFQWLRQNGFPFSRYSEQKIIKDYELLVGIKDVFDCSVEGGRLNNKKLVGGLGVVHCQGEQFYSVCSGINKHDSMIERFNDDNVLKKVLNNRLGISYKECFNITGAMIRQGYSSSGNSYKPSVFNPLVAKSVWNLAKPNSVVLDYSMGFGHRMVGALSLSDKNLTYVGIDPWHGVVSANKTLAGILGETDRVKLYSTGIEVFEEPSLFGKCSMAFSSPPYESVEVYDNGSPSNASSLSKQEFYVWWDKAVKNIKRYLVPSDTTWFVVNSFEKNIDQINQVVLENGFIEHHRCFIQTSVSHFTKKQNITHKQEPVVFYKIGGL